MYQPPTPRMAEVIMKKILCTAPQYCCGGSVNISDNSLIKNFNGNVAELTAPDHNQKSFAD